MIFQSSRHVTFYGLIRRRIDRHLDAWEAGELGILAEDTARTSEQYLATNRGEDSLEHRAKIFHSLVIRGKIRSSVRWITNREKFGFFQPVVNYPKIVKPVLEVLRFNHPGTRPPMAGSFEA